MDSNWTFLTADHGAALGADEAPVGVDTRGSPSLLLGDRWCVVLGTDDVSLGELDGSSS